MPASTNVVKWFCGVNINGMDPLEYRRLCWIFTKIAPDGSVTILEDWACIVAQISHSRAYKLRKDTTFGYRSLSPVIPQCQVRQREPNGHVHDFVQSQVDELPCSRTPSAYSITGSVLSQDQRLDLSHLCLARHNHTKRALARSPARREPLSPFKVYQPRTCKPGQVYNPSP